MIVTYIHSNHPEDAPRVQIRCRNFADAINRIGWHHANLLDLDSFAQNTPEAQKICADSDLLVIHRYLYGPILEAIEFWKARDKKVVVDFDQAINYLTPDIPFYSFWMQGKPLKSVRECGKNSRKSNQSHSIGTIQMGAWFDRCCCCSIHPLGG